MQVSCLHVACACAPPCDLLNVLRSALPMTAGVAVPAKVRHYRKEQVVTTRTRVKSRALSLTIATVATVPNTLIAGMTAVTRFPSYPN